LTFDLTTNARSASEQTSIRPQIVLDIDGVTQIFGAEIIKKIIRVGDTDLNIGEPIGSESAVWAIGGLTPVIGQSDLISFQQGTTTEIRQSLNLDKGSGETISSLVVALVDKSLEITELISPGQVVADLLGRRCKIWLGFADTSWKEDFIVIFRGIIDDIDSSSGLIKLNVAHPDQKKRSKIFTKVDTELNGAIDSTQTTITVDDTAAFAAPVNGPDGSPDTATIKFYVRIGDEVMRYTSKTATTFTGITRGELGTTNVAHSDNDTVDSFVRLTGNAIDLALKLMLSGVNGDFVTGQAVTHIGATSPSDPLANVLYFEGINIDQEFGLTVGDYITTTGAINGANNFSGRQITEVGSTDAGGFFVVDGAALVIELDSTALADFRSQYDTLGTGLGMFPDEVDVEKHNDVKNQFLSSFEYDFYLKDEIDGKTFLSEQLYNPGSAFSIPRNARASVGVHVPPLPTTRIKTIDINSVVNPSKLVLRRTINKNFFNTIAYKFEEPTLESELTRTNVISDSESFDRIDVGVKSLLIESNGMRIALLGLSNAALAANRRLKKFRFGAEFIRGVQLSFKSGFDLEIGDIILFDMETLKISDIITATRSGESRLFEIVNKKINFRTGAVSIDIVDTNFDKDSRFALISPASIIKSATSETSIVIEPIGNFSEFGVNEYKKWTEYIGESIKIRNEDFSIQGTTTIAGIAGNSFQLAAGLGFTPTAGMFFEFDEYDNISASVNLLYAFMRDSDFADGKVQYQML